MDLSGLARNPKACAALLAVAVVSIVLAIYFWYKSQKANFLMSDFPLTGNDQLTMGRSLVLDDRFGAKDPEQSCYVGLKQRQLANLKRGESRIEQGKTPIPVSMTTSKEGLLASNDKYSDAYFASRSYK